MGVEVAGCKHEGTVGAPTFNISRHGNAFLITVTGVSDDEQRAKLLDSAYGCMTANDGFSHHFSHSFSQDPDALRCSIGLTTGRVGNRNDVSHVRIDPRGRFLKETSAEMLEFITEKLKAISLKEAAREL